MKLIHNIFGSAILALSLSIATAPLMAQENKPFTTADDVRAEISEAMEAISDYTAQERKQAVAEASDALDKLDAEIDRQENAARENWNEMSEATREEAREQLQELRQTRNDLGERFGALQASTESAWTELKDDFADAWDAFADAWTDADSGSS